MIPFPDLPSPIARTMDARHLNAVANHPDVRPWLGGVEKLTPGMPLVPPVPVPTA